MYEENVVIPLFTIKCIFVHVHFNNVIMTKNNNN